MAMMARPKSLLAYKQNSDGWSLLKQRDLYRKSPRCTLGPVTGVSPLDIWAHRWGPHPRDCLSPLFLSFVLSYVLKDEKGSRRKGASV